MILYNDNQNKLLSGLIAGMVGAFFVYPIDVVKTKMQNQNYLTKKYLNSFDCCKKIWIQDNIRGFYKGSIIQLIGVGPEKTVKLYAYSYIIKDSKNYLTNHIVGGLFAGLCQSIVTCPYENIKINLQMNNKIKPINLYAGITPCLLRDIPFSGIYFPTFWYLKDKLNYNSFYSGTIAGIPASILCTPMDVIKTRIQTLGNNSHNETIPVIKQIYNNEGLCAFFKGSGLRVLRTCPQLGITLCIYDYLI